MTNLKRNLVSYLTKAALVLPLILLSCFVYIPANAHSVLCQTQIIDSTVLKAFEGIYQMKDNEFAYFQITAVNNNLVAKRMEGDQQFILTRKSEFTFETKDDDGDETISVVFSKNDAGEITQALVADKQVLIKVKNYVPVIEVKLTADQLKAFEGKYQFEEKKDTFLQITATADGLLLKQLWDNKEINFISIGDLAFLNKQMGFPLKFTKDQDGKVVKVLAFNRDTWDKVKE
ncbi:MAG TPA: hypothetical protein VIM16_11725 [Mucilaginibacter sp.]|jgi:hypothetical protein